MTVAMGQTRTSQNAIASDGVAQLLPTPPGPRARAKYESAGRLINEGL
jgi:hypothetical protein